MRRTAAALLLLPFTVYAGEVEDFRAAYKRNLPEPARKELIVQLSRSEAPEVPLLLGKIQREERGSVYLQAWIAKALSDHGAPESLKVVAEMLADARTAPAVALVAEQVLAQVSRPGGLAWMATQGAKRREIRDRITWALATNPNFADAAFFRDRLVPKAERDWRVRTAAAAGLARLGDPGSLEAVRAALAVEDAAPARRWLFLALGRVGEAADLERFRIGIGEGDALARLGALEGLARLQLRPEIRLEALALLVKSLGCEDGRLKADAVRLLEWATGKPLGFDVPAWRAHLQQLGIGPPGAGEAARTQVPEYFGIRLPSRRIVFVLDASQAMIQDLRSGQPLLHLACAKREVERMVEVLPPEASFGIVVFGNAKADWRREGLAPATEENKRAARAWLRARGGMGWPDFGAGLQAAFDLGLDREDRDAPLRDRGADTVVLVSNGRPLSGELRENDLLRWLRIQNRYRSVLLHTVGVGSGEDKAFLKALAEYGGGLFRNVD